MAAIYGNNLHEKLVGVAISKEYLKYNSPFCDLVDDPEWAVDINLALDFNSATNGDLDAADRALQSLTLYSSVLDGSTIDFYVHKMSMNPSFRSAIDTMNHRFTNPSDFDDEFQFDLNDALKDCLNSPCNLFNETSDSIGRMAQTGAANTSDNTFGVGALSASFTNMLDGLDQTIFNKIPAIFQDAFTEVVQVANKAYTNTQSVLAGKENLSVFENKVANGKSFRSPGDMFRYTPDVKSSYDYSAASSNILSKIKEAIGGCFNRFEFKYRYNPYENNMSRPLGEKTLQVNGKQYDVTPDGRPDRTPDNSQLLKNQTGGSSSGSTGVNTVGKSYQNGKVKISAIYNLKAKGSSNAHSHYSVFAALADVDTKTLWYEGYNKTANDVLTLQGESNIGSTYRIGISVQGKDNTFIAEALNGDAVRASDIQRFGTTTQAGAYAAGYTHDLTDEGMETLWNTDETKKFNDGVAVSKGLFRLFMNDPEISHGSASYKGPQRANEFFIAARPAGKTEWAYYKVCDSNGQPNVNVDFTMGAMKHFKSKFNVGEGNLQPAKKSNKRHRKIPGTKWTRVFKNWQENIETMEIRVCQGSIDDVKAQLDASSSIEGLAEGGDVTPPNDTSKTLSDDIASANGSLLEDFDRNGDGTLDASERPKDIVQKDAAGKVQFITSIDAQGIVSVKSF